MSSTNTRLKFLWDAANNLPAKTYTGGLLKSYYLTICRQISQSTNDKNTPLQLCDDEKRMCIKCSSYWFDGNFTVKTESVINKLKNKNDGKRLIESYKNGKCLTKIQKKRAKWFMKKLNSYMVIVCNVCKHRTKIPMKKSTKIESEKQKYQTENNTLGLETQSDVQITTTTTAATMKKKKKKKKKDKFAGLNIKTIESIKSKEINKDSKHIVSVVPSVSDGDGGDGNVMVKKIVMPTIKQSKNPTVQQSKSSLPPSSSLRLSSSSSKKGAKQNSKPIQKQKSKTQQKNALLQLAQALKAGNTKNYQDCSKNDRLKNFLREK